MATATTGREDPTVLALLSPAKKLDFSPPDPGLPHSQADFPDETRQLVRAACQAGRGRLQQAMGLSDRLAALTAERFQNLADEPATNPDNGKQAVLAFAGDTYAGLQAGSMTLADLTWAQDRLRILSGLYGLLRPLDLIRPYRLEMGCSLDWGGGDSLYAFWGKRLAQAADRAVAGHARPVIINLASTEYFRALQGHLPADRVITPVFQEIRDGTPRVIGLLAKRARGAMAGYMVRQRLEKPEDLQAFTEGGYAFQPALSDAGHWVFTRAA